MSNAESCPMGKIKKLLLVTDLSGYSEVAVREAITLARKCETELYVLSVIEVNPEYETFGMHARSLIFLFFMTVLAK